MSASQPGFFSEPLGPQHEQGRAAFSCEVEPLDRYLKQQANQDLRKDLSVTYVLVPAENRSRIAGYYTVCSDTIPLDDLPPELVKKLRLPHYNTIPATLIGRLARDVSYKGKGIGELLLSNALKLAWQTSQRIASWAVTVDSKDEKAKRFYIDFGFIPFADTQRRLYLPMRTIEQSMKVSVWLLACCLLANAQTHATWTDYGGAPDSAQYSSLKQIDRSNVTKLEVAWTYPTGDGGKYFFNPLVANGLIYVMAQNKSIVALDAATGKQAWIHPVEPSVKLVTDRGINYWESKDHTDRRLLFASDNFLQAIDARTGESILSFGDHGRVDLKVGLDRDPNTIHLVQSTTPGRVFENLLILGSATNEGYSSAPGDIRAYDVKTGALAWTFHTVPRPGEFGYETWPRDAWKTVGGANSWGELSLDEKRGIVYVPTGSPKYNFYGANRTGANLFGDCLLALDARTGKRLWHFQMVHHDIWDYDNATGPKLLTIHHNGKTIDAVAQPGKTGFLYVFNRVTGEPLWPVEEKSVPRSDMPGEQAWATQPFPTGPPPFARQKFTEKDLSQFIHDPEERARFRDRLQTARNEGLFTPPALRGTLEMPGNNGGANWGGAAADPTSARLFVVSKDLPCILKLEPDATGTRYTSSFGFLFTSDGLSPIAPPWTSLTSYDLNEGKIRWTIPLGDAPNLKDTGSVYPKVGPVVTAGGLIFTATRDRKVRALDEETGKILWETTLPAALEGIPAVYEINGREYLVVCAAAVDSVAFKTPAKIDGAYVAFALPSLHR